MMSSFKRYDSYGQLTMNWRKLKMQLAEDINVKLIKKHHVKSKVWVLA
jgi:hypothetical protein